ncbi:hypothetical protein ACQ4LE_000587, partial [Meloidogyne hapla]|uniref:Mitochondrial carrier protein n=1 Tax=Meloidogyne hapla TaxID=6305 RepID=A0A1I8BYH2_MELHA
MKQVLIFYKVIFASTVGTLLQIIPAIPIELIKTRLQANNNSIKIKGPLNCALNIIRKEGLIGLYRGGTIMFWRDFIGYLFYIPVYEYFVKNLRNLQKKESFKTNEDFIRLISGGIAGSLSWWIICPLELLKNRLQTFQHQLPLKKRHHWREIFLQVFNEGRVKGGSFLYGMTAFYRGGTLLALRAFPVNACVFYVHSKFLELFL